VLSAGCRCTRDTGKCASEKLAARKAKQFTVQFLRAGQVVELRKIKRGKYFRFLAEVYVDGKNLADALIKAKIARPYDGVHAWGGVGNGYFFITGKQRHSINRSTCCLQQPLPIVA